MELLGERDWLGVQLAVWDGDLLCEAVPVRVMSVVIVCVGEGVAVNEGVSDWEKVRVCEEV